ncbi:TetR/AcrR family transcriptional regulator [Paenibacillus taichungensis]|uniref:TetR/AcrR family transcriptional regulator n=1 Tax=Paenibacillus taichungensis TaxID=484184 RepID=A0ABX2MM96_9BACL|nr:MULTISPECIES: TetR/AcrR family transcriptional regulator [Paenibacillus]OME85431.1 TetR family transcriptional regulator [Paenibacillus pabuli]MEC0109530.1 TetR/AcrR family transcriptional regulator [Paenibacillus taichungensis]MEC0197432.1 TetR/AcrR family transcriptional regulator [Paenibacillus taichungensis]NUU55135.1 TetR/AcrR family transcriptional regulator [Paenibacillus taichungensis]PIH57848.1 TetR/AcrR family transcriptional regulator [Paenibacillus sp. LK1]
MRKGQITKEHIIRESAALFNTKGYTGASLSEIIERCGVRKGGIYNHFESKDEIALAAFDYSVSQMLQFHSQALEGVTSSKDKLLAICGVYIDMMENNTLEGGCPLLNTAVESDDAHPLLKERAQHAMTNLLNELTQVLIQGTEQKEFRTDIALEEVSSNIIAIIEGGVMLSKLYEDSKYIRHAVLHITQFMDDRILIQ